MRGWIDAPGASAFHHHSGAAIYRWRLCFEADVVQRMKTAEFQVTDLGRDIESLQLVFPSLDQALLRDVLHQCGGNIQTASTALLDMVPSADPGNVTGKEPSRSPGNSRRSRPTAPTVGWSVVTAEARQSEQSLSQYARLARNAAPSTDTSAFPQLSRTHEVQDIGRPTSGTESKTWQRKAPATDGVPWKAESISHREWLCNESHGRASASSETEGTVRQLSEIHPWADEALLKDVLAAAGDSVASAAWILSELQAPNTSPNTPSVSPNMSPHTSPHRQHPLRQFAAGNDNQTSRVPGLPSPKGAPPPRPGVSTPKQSSSGPVRWQHQPGTSSSAVPAYPEDDGQDAYYSFRADALQLTRRWQKAAQKAGTSYSGGDHSGARKYARDARILRNSALAAHAAAADAIERANNADKGLDMWTLDLHGLHVGEAIAAVDRRLQQLEEHLSQTKVRSAELKVITGVGNHSSGGEASLGRSVVNHLLGRGVSHSVRGGVVVVQVVARKQGSGHK
ncbi:probable NEDD4-binding protein 2 at C-terminar half [Coccomyxa sp. Obi]|nr:probable NEDD4-binding protein 2 at C-terminar half [Coccomyxa sp. Obi]